VSLKNKTNALTICIDLPIYSNLGEGSIDNMCRIINQFLPHYPIKMMFRVPLVVAVKDKFNYQEIKDNGEETKEKPNIAWKIYQKFKRLCNYNTQIKLCLDITRDLPEDKDIERWCAENLKMITISKNLFLSNKKNFPVLSKAHQRIIKKFMTYKVRISLKGSYPKENLEDYHKYL